ncbi:MAG: 50S ribosomal protein L13 [Dehalococcoidales bacterium]|nr:50S ribosomal protein L13 [Dehalococcoidales bacterium]
MKTYSPKASEIKREWHVIDAKDEVLGKLSTRIATLLMGKHKAMFARNADVGDFVVVINAEKIKFTGKKGEQKMYYRHSGYPGGLKTISLDKLMETKPEQVIEHAVKGMLPRNLLNAKMMKRLRVFTGETHPYTLKKEKTAKTTAPAAN